MNNPFITYGFTSASRPSAPVGFYNFTGDVYLKSFTEIGFFRQDTKQRSSLKMTGDAEIKTEDQRM